MVRFTKKLYYFTDPDAFVFSRPTFGVRYWDISGNQ